MKKSFNYSNTKLSAFGAASQYCFRKRKSVWATTTTTTAHSLQPRMIDFSISFKLYIWWFIESFLSLGKSYVAVMIWETIACIYLRHISYVFYSFIVLWIINHLMYTVLLMQSNYYQPYSDMCLCFISFSHNEQNSLAQISNTLFLRDNYDLC
jgi:uncharacterized membrane protein